jgi:hypothetical protein
MSSAWWPNSGEVVELAHRHPDCMRQLVRHGEEPQWPRESPTGGPQSSALPQVRTTVGDKGRRQMESVPPGSGSARFE